MFVVLAGVAFTIKFKVAIESQPAVLIKLAVYIPAALMFWPFHVYGSWLSQIVVFVVLVTVEFTVKFNVAMESHPAALIKLAVYVPAELMFRLFQVNGSWLSQMVAFVVLVVVALTTKFNVAMESHPAALVKLAVYVPAAIIV
jgi:hypothetical protein